MCSSLTFLSAVPHFKASEGRKFIEQNRKVEIKMVKRRNEIKEEERK
jgi:hypothetical protein